MASIDRDNLKAFKSDFDELDATNRHMKKLVHDFEIEHDDLITKIKNLRETIATKREQIVIEAAEEFKETNKKKLLGGIGIREREKLIYEPEKAMQWALNHELCLMLDTKKFEKLAKDEESTWEFVEFETETVVTFPKELDI